MTELSAVRRLRLTAVLTAVGAVLVFSVGCWYAAGMPT